MNRLIAFYKKRYHPYFKDKSYLITLVSGILFLVLSLYVNFLAGNFATRVESNSVTDVVLSNIRVYDVDWIFIYGMFILCAFIAILCFAYPKKAPYILKSIALFTIIRSVFISLTHIAPFPVHLIINPTSLINKFTFDGDLFFSGHTGLPYLMALVFWDNKYLRFIFFVTSIIFGITVLLAHLHYSIDVLAAFFITYTISHIATFLFKSDRKMFFEQKQI